MRGLGSTVVYRWKGSWIEKVTQPEPAEPERGPAGPGGSMESMGAVGRPSLPQASRLRLERAVDRLEAASRRHEGFEFGVAAERLWSAALDAFASSEESLPFVGGDFGPRRSELLALLSRLSRSALKEPDKAADVASQAAEAFRLYLAKRAGPEEAELRQ